MSPKGAFTPEFTPVARPGNVLQLDFGDEIQLYRITKHIGLPSIQMDSVTVSNNDTEKPELTNLEVWSGWLAQYRLINLAEELPDGVTVTADLGGRQAPVWTAKNTRGSVDDQTGVVSTFDVDGDTPATADQYTHLTELFVHEDTVPYFEFDNQSGGPQTIQLTFSGFGFAIEGPLQNEDGEQPVYVPVESVQGG